MIKKLSIFVLLLAGCATHYHAVEVSSTPSAQEFTIVAEQENGKTIWPLNDPSAMYRSEENIKYRWITPYEVIFPGDVY